MKGKPELLEKQFEGLNLEEPKEENEIAYSNALRFQRLMQGWLLLLALFFKWIPLVYFVFLVMGTAACFSPKLALFSIIYIKIVKPARNFKTRSCECSWDKGEQRFACALGSFFLFMAIIFNFLNFPLGWFLVGTVSALSLLAGTTNFCLGSLLFFFFRSILTRRGK